MPISLKTGPPLEQTSESMKSVTVVQFRGTVSAPHRFQNISRVYRRAVEWAALIDDSAATQDTIRIRFRHDRLYQARE